MEPPVTTPSPAPPYSSDYNDLPTGEVDFYYYLRVIYRRRWIAITAFLLVVLSVAAYTFTATPIYEARVQLMIEPENQNPLNFAQPVEQSAQSWDPTDYYQTQYKILQSRRLARKTLDALHLWDSPEFVSAADAKAGAAKSTRPGQTARELVAGEAPVEAALLPETPRQSRTVNKFLAQLTVTPTRNSRLVDVKFASADRQLAANVANKLAVAYIAQTDEFRRSASTKASSYLDEQIDAQRKKLEASENSLQTLREQGEGVALDDRQNIVVQRLAELSSAVTKASTERIEKEAQYKRLLSVAAGPGSNLDTFPAILSNTFIQQLKGQLADLQRQQAQMSEKYEDKHPEMAKIRNAIAATEAKLRGEIGNVQQSVRNEFLSAQAQERTLAADLERQKGDALALGKQGITYGIARREWESNKQIYDSLLQRQKETGVSSELKSNNIRVVDDAQVPLSPVSPNRRLNMLLALLGGTMLALGLVFFFERLDNHVKSPDDLKALGLPFLGLVPAIDTSDLANQTPLLNNGVPANFSEAFRTVRSSVLFSTAESGPRSVVVTSTAPGEGKTLVATNLAMALAQAGQKVLLIDADMRRARLHHIFDVNRAPGLSDLVTSQGNPVECVRTTAMPTLWLVPAGTKTPNPAELLGSKKLHQLLDVFTARYDWVVVDTPPVMAVSDAALIAHRSTGVVFVLRSEVTNRNAADQAIEQLSGARAKMMGAVLNGVKLHRHAYYYARYYKREYSDYYQDEASGE
jgi:capsular exopolysaccharide synthesis family protein